MSTSNKELQSWVEEVSKMTKPENILLVQWFKRRIRRIHRTNA